jgi:23S rRNA (guanosine2251-2'-O)-methyltransferase
VIAERRAAQVTAAVCRASAGAVEHVPVARAGNVADLGFSDVFATTCGMLPGGLPSDVGDFFGPPKSA